MCNLIKKKKKRPSNTMGYQQLARRIKFRKAKKATHTHRVQIEQRRHFFHETVLFLLTLLPPRSHFSQAKRSLGTTLHRNQRRKS